MLAGPPGHLSAAAGVHAGPTASTEAHSESYMEELRPLDEHMTGSLCTEKGNSQGTDSSNSSMPAAAAGVDQHHQQQQQLHDAVRGFNYNTAEHWNASHGATAGYNCQLLPPYISMQQQQQHEGPCMAAGHPQPAATYDRSSGLPIDHISSAVLYSHQLPAIGGTAAAAAAAGGGGGRGGFGQHSSGSSWRRKAAAAAQGGKTKGRSGPKSKFSPFIGVSQYKRTGRWEAHIWDSSSSTKGSTVTSKGGKGKQLHLGSFHTAIQAAKAYDRAAILLRGPEAALNFPVEEYTSDPVLQELSQMSRQEMVLALRKTCDMEMEAAALEAFHAKVPAGAFHLLQNITGLPLAISDDGSMQATSSYDAEGMFSCLQPRDVEVLHHQQQQWQWQQPQQQGGSGEYTPSDLKDNITWKGHQWQQLQHAQIGSVLTVPQGVPPHSAALPGQRPLSIHHPTGYSIAAAGLPASMHINSSPTAAPARHASVLLPETVQPTSPFGSQQQQQQQRQHPKQQQHAGEIASISKQGVLLPHGSAAQPGSYTPGGFAAPPAKPGYSLGPQPEQMQHPEAHRSGLATKGPSLTIRNSPNPGPVVVYAYDCSTAADLAHRHNAQSPFIPHKLNPKPSKHGQVSRPDSTRLSGLVRPAVPQLGGSPGFWHHDLPDQIPDHMPGQTEAGADESSTSSSGATGGSSMITSSGSEQHVQHSPHPASARQPQQPQYGDSATAVGRTTQQQGWSFTHAYNLQQQQHMVPPPAVHQRYTYHSPRQQYSRPSAAAATAGAAGCLADNANPNRCSASGSCPTHTDLHQVTPTSPGGASPHSFSFTPCMVPPHQRWLHSSPGSSTAFFTPGGQGTTHRVSGGCAEGQQQQQQQQLSPRHDAAALANAVEHCSDPSNAAGGVGHHVGPQWHRLSVLQAQEMTPRQQQQQQSYNGWPPHSRLSFEGAAADAAVRLGGVATQPHSRQCTPQPQAAAIATATAPAIPHATTSAAVMESNPAGALLADSRPSGFSAVDVSMQQPYQYHHHPQQQQQQQQQPQQNPQQPHWSKSANQTELSDWETLLKQQQQQEGMLLPLVAEVASAGCSLPSYMQRDMRISSLVSDDRNSGSNSAHSATTPPAATVAYQTPLPAPPAEGTAAGQQQQQWVDNQRAAAAAAAVYTEKIPPQVPERHHGQKQQQHQETVPACSTHRANMLPDGTAAAAAMIGYLSDHAVEVVASAAATAIARSIGQTNQHRQEEPQSSQQQQQQPQQHGAAAAMTLAGSSCNISAGHAEGDCSMTAILPAEQLSTKPGMRLSANSADARYAPHTHSPSVLNLQGPEPLSPHCQAGQGLAVEHSAGSDLQGFQLMWIRKPARKVLNLAPTEYQAAAGPDSQAGGGPDGQATGREGGTAVLLLRPSCTPPASPAAEPAAAEVPVVIDTNAAALQPAVGAAAPQQQQLQSPPQTMDAGIPLSSPRQLAAPVLTGLGGPMRSVSDPLLVAELARLASVSGSGDLSGSLGKLYRESPGLPVYRQGSGSRVYKEGSGAQLAWLLEHQQILFQQHSLPGLDQLDLLLLGGNRAATVESAAADDVAALAARGSHAQQGLGSTTAAAEGAGNGRGASQMKDDMPAPAATAATDISRVKPVGAPAAAAAAAEALADIIVHTDTTAAAIAGVEQQPVRMSASKRVLQAADTAAVGRGQVKRRNLPDSGTDVGELAVPAGPATARTTGSAGVSETVDLSRAQEAGLESIAAAGAEAAGRSIAPQAAALNAAWLQMMQD